MRQHLTTSCLHSLLHCRIAGIGDALITLAMIVGTHVEYRVVLTVVPTDDLVILLDKREKIVCPVLQLRPLLHLGKEPRTGDNSVSLKQFDARCSTHLT